MGKPSILTTIVLYHPDEKQLLALVKVCAQSANTHILLFDNAEISDALKEKISDSIVYVQSPANVGVGGAHYYACQMAVEKKFDFILLLDQDSQLPSNFVNDMVAGFYRTQACYSRLAAVGPSWTDPRILKPTQNKPTHLSKQLSGLSRLKHLLKKNHKLKKLVDLWRNKNKIILISSGMLICVSALEIVGFPKREYFIDLVDTEWCLRVHAKQYQVIKLEDVWMEHTIGNVKKIGRRHLYYQTPIRYYYTMRNSFLLFSDKQLPFFHRSVILLKSLLQLSKLPFVPEPLASFSAAWRGLKEGIRRAWQ